jgi:TonB family protein
MYKIITLVFACILCSFSSFAQKKQRDTVRKYLDERLAFTNKANMTFPALAVRDGSHWQVMSVYEDTSILLNIYFKDEDLTIKDGPFVLYHPKKQKAIEGRFVDNVKQGVWKIWYENGQLKDSGRYINNYQTGIWHSWNDSGQLVAIKHFQDSIKITGVIRGYINPREKRPTILAGDTSITILDGPSMSFYPNGQLRDSGDYRFNRKEGLWKYKYSNGNLESKGSYIRNVQFGIWEYYRENGLPSTKEKYENNKITALECFDEQGNPSGNACSIQKLPVAQGKFLDFNKYALDNMFWPEQLKRSDVEGMVEIEYTISKEGKMTSIKILSTPHQLMSAEVIRFFKTLEWSPAVSHNRPVDHTMKYRIPFFR